jgi:hypothetical protein
MYRAHAGKTKHINIAKRERNEEGEEYSYHQIEGEEKQIPKL